MSTATVNGSAYPARIATLMPAALDLTTELGAVPSRNRLMREYRIGAAKADEIRAVLTRPLVADQPEPAPVPTLDSQATAAAVDPDRPAVTQANRVLASPDAAPVDSTDGPDQSTPVASDVPDRAAEVATASPLATVAGHPGTSIVTAPPAPRRSARSWPVLLLALPAFVAIWSGWVGLGELAGFGVVHPLPGIIDGFSLNTAITLPVGMETYAAYALHVWLSGAVPGPARRFAKWSAIGALVLGAAGQVAYHLMTATHVSSAPWPITTAVACLPVAVLGMGAALAHLIRSHVH